VSALPPIGTGAWYDERQIQLDVPASWSVRVHLPDVPPPMEDPAIQATIEDPVGMPPLRQLAAGRRRPLLLVDDLTRPTPVARILPHVLVELEKGGIPASEVSIMSATGTHGPASREAILRKVGSGGSDCRLLGHDDLGRSVGLGSTSFGSRVEVDPEVARSDLLIGIGGIYPQNTAAFGGGAKMILGVLSRRSIEDLHFGHPSDDGRYDIDNDFRRDVGEMARMAGLRFSVSAMVDQDRRLVWLKAGDHEAYYAEAVLDAKRMFAAPMPSQADVVIANAFPMDVSATFMYNKGVIPLRYARPGASRILIAACSEGIGHHGLFPLRKRRGLSAELTTLRRQLRYSPRTIPGLVLNRGRQALGVGAGGERSRVASSTPARQIICFVTSKTTGLRQDDLPGMRLLDEWSAVVSAVAEEQAGVASPAIDLYPCSPLQLMSPSD
jgi:lactate racemase